ncbi:DUF805 domain-containing protein [Massilia sp. TSP1-1-2]|uniref:DUF805 domain-containing protein n=1 Tax=Massilia sp. TSP1-1-2 TaxID=2804649 RepID=UPI003CF40175
MSSETFEQVLAAAQAAGSTTQAWKKFVNTRFFVAIVRSADGNPKNFTLQLADADADGNIAVRISEQRERLVVGGGNTLVTLSGAEVVRRLQAEAGILVALSEGVFAIARDRVDWLRKGIEAARARAAEKAQPAAASFPSLEQGSLPAPASAPDSAPAPAPTLAPLAPAAATLTLAKAAPQSSPVTRNQVGVLDVAALKPRNVTMPKIGLEFFVPASWQESATATGLRFTGTEHACTVEASGFHRPNLSMAQWLEMRLALVRQEMRYLTQDGESYPFEGELWRGRVTGMATEFTGTFPGDACESRYLVACIWTDGVLASITVRAPAGAFEEQRALWKWLLGRVDMNASAASVYSPPASLGGIGGDWEEAETPPMFGFSLAGRMGRMRVLAYSFPVMLSLAVVGIIAAVLVPASKALGLTLLVAGVPACIWFSVRLMVLRMHDVNLSGKWLAGAFALMLLGGVLQNWIMLGVLFVVFWIASMVIYCFIPGTDGENDYGEQPGPNSTLVNVGATLFILLQFGQIGAASSGKYNNRLPFPVPRGSAAAAKASVPFSPPGNPFTVALPGVPVKVALPAAMVQQLGEVELHQYQLAAGGNVYTVQSIDYHDRMPDNRFDVMDAMQRSVMAKDGTLMEATPTLLKGATGRQVKIGTPGGGLRAARFAVVGTHFYMVSIEVPDAAKGAAATDAFLASFKLN